MSKPELTKQLIADTIKNLAAKKHIDKISVSEIVDTAGINRQTFYYHFMDKQELICWIFDTDVSKLTDKKKNDTMLDDIAEYIYSEKDFYKDAITSEVQNGLRAHIYDVLYSRAIDEILIIVGNRKIDENALTSIARFFSCALEGELVHWAQEGMKVDNIKFAGEYAIMLKELLAFAINKYLE